MHRSWFALALVLVLGCAKYDKLVEANITCDEKWANIEAQLQRRYDLIPNIVATVKAAAKFESETLTKLTEARASAGQIKLTAEDLSDPVKFEKFQRAQDQLSGSLSQLLVVRENYPELKSNQSFQALMVELEGTENRILRSREEYNAAVKTYNSELGKVGGQVVNKVTGKPFQPRVFFTASSEAKTTVPKVDL
jgi:LemA protein